jgi:2,3-bisphosphoglycerate-dependent phosphoglycerate mutase
MTIGIKLGSITDEIGSPDFFFAFFSTISANLETKGWGTRFPIFMNNLYQVEVKSSDAVTALAELDTIKEEFSHLSVDKVVWSVEDRTLSTPWGSDISSHIDSLANYFVTSTGRDMISSLYEIFEELRDRGGVVKVVSY